MSLRIAIVTISDRSAKGIREDESGPALVQACQGQGWIIVKTAIIPDEITSIQKVLVDWSDGGDVDVILTSGGTGLSPRDVTPEATLSVIDRLAPGLAEVMRQEGLKITPHAMLSRAVAGTRKQTLIINLPGSPRGAVENLNVVIQVLPHAVELLREAPQAEHGHHK